MLIQKYASRPSPVFSPHVTKHPGSPSKLARAGGSVFQSIAAPRPPTLIVSILAIWQRPRKRRCHSSAHRGNNVMYFENRPRQCASRQTRHHGLAPTDLRKARCLCGPPGRFDPCCDQHRGRLLSARILFDGKGNHSAPGMGGYSAGAAWMPRLRRLLHQPRRKPTRHDMTIC